MKLLRLKRLYYKFRVSELVWPCSVCERASCSLAPWMCWCRHCACCSVGNANISVVHWDETRVTLSGGCTCNWSKRRASGWTGTHWAAAWARSGAWRGKFPHTRPPDASSGYLVMLGRFSSPSLRTGHSRSPSRTWDTSHSGRALGACTTYCFYFCWVQNLSCCCPWSSSPLGWVQAWAAYI